MPIEERQLKHFINGIQLLLFYLASTLTHPIQTTFISNLQIAPEMVMP